MPSPVPLPQCSILLLAGGRGQRMGGQDKGLLDWRGQPLIAHLHALTRPLSDDLIISCNRNQARYANYADRLVSDPDQDFPGPLAGLCAGLAVARHGHLLVLPCDMPKIDADLLDAMLGKAAEVADKPLVVRQGPHWQPLLCVIPTHFKDAFEDAWAQGVRSPRQVLLQLDAQALVLAEQDPRLDNLNTPALLDSNGGPPDIH